MSGGDRVRVARVYTAARRHPWVLGKLGDFRLPLGPYTPAQLVVLGGGAFLLIKTYAWWSWAGPVPVALWLGAVWAVRGAQIAGQSPFTAVAGVVSLLLRHPAGRVEGRVARDRAPSYLRVRFVIAPPVPAEVGAAAPAPVEGGAGVAVGDEVPVVEVAAGSGLARLVAEKVGRAA
ncbi:hypothetical protein [Streptomyces sp. RerS4]|uniref:hypothetical protein n=1 Tax=Streptomyces sp. RerS4 TaxID=2942449 RepID=UPI00201CA93D|nr:hypothetical protein [Streptomyces sp. RerS4]UQW99122.1 hypothetical protein M4D82_00135 [Streptomyces sp. RerS4]